jgi:dTDP-3-amino-3,4,6-trideoxy-alpha-D-glucose transaminase
MTIDSVPFFDLGALVRDESADLHEALNEVIHGGYFVGGPIVERFEAQFAEFLGVRHVIGVGNGLDAIRIALEAHHVGVGDEVIVPAFTYYASWLGVTQTGARLIPVDVDPLTANIDVGLVEAAITSTTRAILAVHLYGQSADLAGLRDIADRYGILLIEDAAQSHGSLSTAGMSGSVGDSSAFSFYPTKNLGALGDAGAVATNDDATADRMRSRRSYGQGASKYDHVDTGWNSRLDPLQAAFLSLHLPKLTEWTARRRSIARTYREALVHVPEASVVGPVEVEDSVWHHFVLRASDRIAAQAYLAGKGVSSDVHYPYSIDSVKPMATFRRVFEGQRFPAAESLAASVVSLPIGPWMSPKQVDHVANALTEMPADLLEQHF